MKKVFTAISIIAIFQISCSKKGTDQKSAADDVDIYISGSHWLPDTPGPTVSYWKNGEPPTNLFTPLVLKGAGAADMEVYNGDVYVTGGIQGVAQVWKNGQRTALAPEDIYSWSSDLAISNGDVYISGTQVTNAFTKFGYWKNNEFKELARYSKLDRLYGYCTAIAVQASDVHALAYWGDYTLYWKNGVLDTFAHNLSPEATAIKLDGGDVYISGSLNGYPAYWKNGEPTVVSNVQGAISDIVIKDGDIHLVGNESNFATYWKNGVKKVLDNGHANELAVNGSDVYVTGFWRRGRGELAVYWKNGERHYLIPLTDRQGTETANGIVIVPR